MSLVDDALRYAADWSWPVFPVSPSSKAPIIAGARGVDDDSTDPDTIRAWWTTYPTAMIGVRTGSRESGGASIFLFDIDVRPDRGVDGFKSLAELETRHGPLPITMSSRSAGGGEHRFFVMPPDQAVPTTTGVLGAGIDTKSDGGYFIAPPSRRADGREYAWINSPGLFDPVAAPDWLLEALGPKPERPRPEWRPPPPPDGRFDAYARAAVVDECRRVASAPGGTRNHQLNASAFSLGTLVGAGMLSRAEVEAALLDAARACGLVQDDGERAALATIRSGLGAGEKHPRQPPKDRESGFGGGAHEQEGEDRSPPGGNPGKSAPPPGDGHGHGDGGNGDDDGDDAADSSRNGHPGNDNSGSGPNSSNAGKPWPSPIPLHWHGEAPPEPPRWLVEGLVPETGKGLLAGQWGTAKTFVALDLAAAVMTGSEFAGHPVTRKGGVLFIAAEAAGQIPVRLRGLAEHKLDSSTPLPFCWIEECPSILKTADAVPTLCSVAGAAATELRSKHGLELALIVVDTIAASAGFTSENDSAEGQQVMNALETLSRRTGALVLGVDHFGKMVDTGTRGSSAKEAAADVVLALLADRSIGGAISNTRMAVRKLRAGSTGAEVPFDLQVVSLRAVAGHGSLFPETTCVINWRPTSVGGSDSGQKDHWPQSLRVFKAAMVAALAEYGSKLRPFGSEGPAVRAVPQLRVRTEFVARYPADGADERSRADAKRKSFSRAMTAALQRELIASRDLGGFDHLWFTDRMDETDIHRTDGRTGHSIVSLSCPSVHGQGTKRTNVPFVRFVRSRLCCVGIGTSGRELMASLIGGTSVQATAASTGGPAPLVRYAIPTSGPWPSPGGRRSTARRTGARSPPA